MMESNEDETFKAAFASYYRPQHFPQSQPPQAHQLPSHSELAVAQQSTPPRQYTTVGSVYNPQPQPLQPPVRRGRTVKSLFPYKSDSPAGPPQLQYTPLQQNSDRAISPVRFDPDVLHSNVNINRQERQVLQNFGVAVPTLHQASTIRGSLQSPISDSANAPRFISNRAASGIDVFAEHSAADNPAMFVDPSADSDNGSDGADTKPISAMNFNSLTNLASYPNPMQRAAQKVLASHRPNPVPASGVSLSVPYLYKRTAPSIISERTDIVQSQLSDIQSNPYNAEPESLLSLSETPMYMAALPRVRGAPAPLTAGPPGVRQLRPTTFEQETLQRAREFDDENPMLNPYNMHIPFNQHIGGPSFEGESMSSALAVETTEEDEDEDDDNDSYFNNEMAWIVDTISEYDAGIFYPDGLPKNFNPYTQPISPHWAAERLEKIDYASNRNSIGSQEKFLAERKRLIDNHFYSGVNTFNKTFDIAVLEHRHRSVAHLVGRPFKEPQDNEGKVINRQLSVHDASLMQLLNYELGQCYAFAFNGPSGYHQPPGDLVIC
ncbi:hypothetical protein F5Y12DRAFT_738156 [Xylaria sp. FL1777]|nr:hypothetical protein F5Y12DRAFT_738156 [Xylaria sp. FL1777]